MRTEPGTGVTLVDHFRWGLEVEGGGGGGGVYFLHGVNGLFLLTLRNILLDFVSVQSTTTAQVYNMSLWKFPEL